MAATTTTTTVVVGGALLAAAGEEEEAGVSTPCTVPLLAPMCVVPLRPRPRPRLPWPLLLPPSFLRPYDLSRHLSSFITVGFFFSFSFVSFFIIIILINLNLLLHSFPPDMASPVSPVSPIYYVGPPPPPEALRPLPPFPPTMLAPPAYPYYHPQPQPDPEPEPDADPQQHRANLLKQIEFYFRSSLLFSLYASTISL